MNSRPTSLRTWLILLLLVAGPLQAQVAFACAMMDQVIVDDCCCDDGAMTADPAKPDCENPPLAAAAGCCDKTVTVSIDQEARHDTPVVKPIEPKSGLDPPPAIIAEFNLNPLSLATVNVGGLSLVAFSATPGNQLYLRTLRLRL